MHKHPLSFNVPAQQRSTEELLKVTWLAGLTYHLVPQDCQNYFYTEKGTTQACSLNFMPFEGEKTSKKPTLLFSFFTLTSARCTCHPLASCPWMRGGSTLAGTDCAEQKESLCLQGKMRYMAMVCIPYISDHRSTDCLLLLMKGWAVWYFF